VSTTIQLEAHAPDELPAPTEKVRWHIAGDYCGIPLVQIEGERDDVVGFVLDHWGEDFYAWGLDETPETDEAVDAAVDDFLAQHAVPAQLLAEAARLGVDVEVERFDPYFLAKMLAEINAVPEAERAAAVRAVNDGSTPADRASY